MRIFVRCAAVAKTKRPRLRPVSRGVSVRRYIRLPRQDRLVSGTGLVCPRRLEPTSTAQPRSTVGTVADCYRGHGRGEDRENVGVKHAEVVTARLVQDERGWLRLAG